MKLDDKFEGKLGKPVAYFPNLANFLGSTKQALFISQLGYWEGKQRDKKNGWIYKTQQEMQAETGLTRASQETVRRKLKRLGVLKEKRAQIPARLHYKVDWDLLLELYQDWYYENNTDPDELDSALTSEGY